MIPRPAAFCKTGAVKKERARPLRFLSKTERTGAFSSLFGILWIQRRT